MPAVAPSRRSWPTRTSTWATSSAARRRSTWLASITRAPAAACTRACAWNASFNYTLPGLTAGASYVVRLHFVELSFTAAGSRTFNVAINGTNVLSNFDIFAAVGQNHALEKEFSATANGSGQIVVAFSRGAADRPGLSPASRCGHRALRQCRLRRPG